ncbi:GNAT family N-acetyltransferase [Gottfriedia acidiceleris]|uniref:GNAT family N-acetyltransferase n=1 Tax=Gottfriedia acidiceleris TaxID=371036 RepID=UPI000B44E0BE|nr:GNAT family N-acetyltransferase [Gottfriedia acidiceleris]
MIKEHYNFNPFPKIDTDRLVLRQMNNEDQYEIFALRSNTKVSQYINRPIAKEVDEALQYIMMINGGIKRNDWVLWAITLKERDQLIGTICLWNFSIEQLKGEVGYELSPELQGKGVMQEALTAVLAYGFNTLKLKVIEGFVQSENQKSIQILEKNKFINKGLVNRESINEEDIHSYIFELTNEMYYS